MNTTITITAKTHFRQTVGGRKVLKVGEPPPSPPGRIPRVARLLALAHRFEKLIRDGEVRDYVDLARLGHVTRARVTQIMNLLSLAPDIQEDILLLAPVKRGQDPVHERQLRPIVAMLDWRKQRQMWTSMMEHHADCGSRLQ